jgi:serine/threonine protein kinase
METTMVMPDDEELLAELLIQWEELYERGQDKPARELCKDHPHLADELGRRIAAMKATDWLNNPDPPAGAPPAIAVQPLQGRVLAGRYRLDDLIAEGGFAQVWRAYDTELQRIVAIKVPKPGRLESSESFMAEARRVARLKHPGIVPVHDVGVENDRCFIVSEFIEGGSLAEQIARMKPSQDQVIRWLCEIADALEYAHLHGVIHRDIKPANILIDHHGRALLADFGIAQSAQKTGSFAPSLGTLRYMSPEQLEGKPATPQSDIFSLGVVLYECLTGKLPYTATDPTGLRREIIAGRPPEQDRRLPTNVAVVTHTAMSQSPEKRHTSAAHFAAALRRAGSRNPRSIRRLAAWWILAFGSLFGIVWSAWHSNAVTDAAKGNNGDTTSSEITIPTKPPSPLPDGTKAVVVVRFDKYLGRSFTPLLVEKGVRVATHVWSLEDVDLTGVRCVLITAASYDPEHRPTDREVAILQNFVRDGGVCLLCGLTWHIKQSVPQHPLNLFSKGIGIYFGGSVRRPKAVPGGPLDGISLDVPGPGYNPSAIIVSTTDAHVLGREHGTDGAASIVAVPYGKGTFIGIGHHVLLSNRPLLERLIATYVPDLIPQTTSHDVLSPSL